MRFGMMDCKAITTPMASNLKLLCDASSETIDATIYRQNDWFVDVLDDTRPNVCFAVNTLSQFVTDPRHVHLVTANHVLRYLKCTIEYGFKYAMDQ